MDDPYHGNVENEHDDKSDFLVVDTVCAVATDASSIDTVWFIRIISDDGVAQDDIWDDINTKFWLIYSIWKINLERHYESKNGQTFNLKKKKVYFYPESVVYQFAQCEERKGKLFISNKSIVEIICFVGLSFYMYIFFIFKVAVRVLGMISQKYKYHHFVQIAA